MAKSRNPKQIASRSTLVGTGGERQDQAGGKHPPLTTAQGIAVADNQNSLRKQAHGGPPCWKDFILREEDHSFPLLNAFPSASCTRRSGAHGFFELTKSLAKYTSAGILTDKGTAHPGVRALLHCCRRRRFCGYPTRCARFRRQSCTPEGRQLGSWSATTFRCSPSRSPPAIPRPDPCGEDGAGSRLPAGGSPAPHLLGLRLTACPSPCT